MSRTARRRPKSAAASLVIITGLSGSGKGSVLRTLEDLGYYCVDHLPLQLIPTFADLMARSPEVPRAAIVIDIREGEALGDFPALFRRLGRAMPVTLVFVEASDSALLRRFSETRRPHPLGAQTGARMGAHLPVREGIQRERKLLEPLRALADLHIDTTRFNPHELRRFVAERFAVTGRPQPLLLNIVSFGYRHGVPPDAELVFDVRFLPNPNFVPALKPLTGRDPRVSRYVFSARPTRQFIRHVGRLLAFLLPHYRQEGKSYLTIAFGCTGGRHRSVAVAEALGRQLAGGGHEVKISHRDLLKAG
jgi:UPF0042 nucleotide-binding protein